MRRLCVIVVLQHLQNGRDIFVFAINEEKNKQWDTCGRCETTAVMSYVESIPSSETRVTNRWDKQRQKYMQIRSRQRAWATGRRLAH